MRFIFRLDQTGKKLVLFRNKTNGKYHKVPEMLISVLCTLLFFVTFIIAFQCPGVLTAASFGSVTILLLVLESRWRLPPWQC